jgi:hypothetical protein
MSQADQIRDYVRRTYIEPARQRHEDTVRIMAGDVAKALHLQRNMPNICQVLGGKKFQSENELKLIERNAPPSGQSNTATFVFHVDDPKPQTSRFAGLLSLEGIGKEVFAALGGGEAFLRSEREHFYAEGSEKERLFGNGKET